MVHVSEGEFRPNGGIYGTARLGLRDVTLVGNDTGGTLVQLLTADGNALVARAVQVRGTRSVPHTA